jgi:hypothetical protein
MKSSGRVAGILPLLLVALLELGLSSAAPAQAAGRGVADARGRFGRDAPPPASRSPFEQQVGPRERDPAFRAPAPYDPGASLPAQSLGHLTREQRRQLREQIRAAHSELRAGGRRD